MRAPGQMARVPEIKAIKNQRHASVTWKAAAGLLFRVSTREYRPGKPHGKDSPLNKDYPFEDSLSVLLYTAFLYARP